MNVLNPPGPRPGPPPGPPSFALRWERREPPLSATAVLAVGDTVPALAAATRDRLLGGARLAVLTDDGPMPDSVEPPDAVEPPGAVPVLAASGVPGAVRGPGPVEPPADATAFPDGRRALPSAPRLLLVLGAEGDLPWADGARYLGLDAGLLVPTTARPGPAPALWRRALGAADGQLCVLVPGHALVADPPPPATAAALEPYTGSAAR
ncbi:hypothetical protein GCM10010495_49510 [Kitasatospora herbaricolor]|uniref:bpX5 domain-containing protein n=1 Tax=Kitasatospora herbaricolor TaxID=68217 RepID=UPI00174AED78|nr:hypothetical protein [Kitasatospora herbaricolor]MDQ0305683.1 hypothetical protein [Kitasatospora herbaricolor]GGV27449.1 hypothetical protein GCM10010495_49510 [Kitasatospora herbaricolor]